MKSQKKLLIKIIVVQCLLVLCVASQDFDFFYFVQQVRPLVEIYTSSNDRIMNLSNF